MHVIADADSVRAQLVRWSAPEAMHDEPLTSAADVWSFAVLVWEVFSHGATPYNGGWLKHL